MSFILDALKKSESQRQRNTGPGFATVRSGSGEQAIPIWVPLLGGLLLINAVVLAVLFWPGDEQQPAATAAPPIETVTVASTQPMTPDQPRRVVRSLAQEASASDTTPAIDGTRDATTAKSKSKSNPGSGTPAAAGSVIVMPENEMDAFLGLPDPAARTSGGGTVTHVVANPNANEDYLRDLTDLRLNGEINLPDLHLDVLSYAPEANNRWIFVNMKKYVEGDTLREGPQVEEITEDGAVLIYNGQRFSLRPE